MRHNLKLVAFSGSPKKVRDPEMEGIEQRGNRIRITFWWLGQRCRETLKWAATAKNVEAAKRLRKRILLEIEAGTFRYFDHFPESKRAKQIGITPAPSRLFSEFAEQWLSNKSGVSTASIKDYRSSLDRFWLPSLGAIRADQLVPSMIHEAIGKIPWLSAKQKNNALVSLRAVLKLMHGDEATRKNLVEFIDNDKLQKPEPNPLSPDEISAVLNYIEEHFGLEMRNIFEVGFFTGLRPGELISLYWTDLSLDLELLTVQRSWGHDKDGDEAAYTRTKKDKTKTKKVRHVELSSRAIAALKRQLQFTGDRKEIFVNRAKRAPYSSSNHLYKRVWVPTLQALQIPPRRMYQMRHSYATMNLMAGANPVWISEQLGHEKADLIFSTYGKWIKGADKVRQKGLLDGWLEMGSAPNVPQSPEDEGDS